MATSRYLIDIFTRHQVYFEGLKTSVASEADPLLRSLEDLILTTLAKAGVDKMNELSAAQLENLIGEIQRNETALFGSYASDLTKRLEGVADYESDFAEQALRAATVGESVVEIPAGTAWLYAKTHPIQATGQLLEDFISGWTAKDIAAVEATLRNAHAQGWTLQQTISAVRGTRAASYADGLIERMRRDISSLVRTTIQHMSNAAQMAVIAANADLLIGYRFVATLDSRTTIVCRSLDGRVFKIGEGPVPPLHINCRSITVPEMNESVKLLGGGLTRAAQGGPVPASMTYYEWLHLQPASFQDSVLGKTRGELFRSGGLSAQEFARLNLNRRFQPLTLAEMQQLHPEVFKRIEQ